MSALTNSTLPHAWSASSTANVPIVIDRAASEERNAPRALLFEIDNVLHDATLWQRWLWQLLTRLGMQRDFHSFCTIWQRGYMHDVYCGGRELASAMRAFLTDCGLTTGQIDEVEASSSARRREFCDAVRPLPGVVKTISQLAGSGITLGVLANSECGADELRGRLDRLGLAGRFQFLFSSRDLGHAMPEGACYQAAIDTLRMPSHCVALVSCQHDELAGAASAGMRTVALNVATFSRPDFAVQRFEDLLSVCTPAASH